jgi:hypothetical protein
MNPALALAVLLSAHGLATAQPAEPELPPEQKTLRMEVFEQNRVAVADAARAALAAYGDTAPQGWKQYRIARRAMLSDASHTVVVLRQDDAARLVELAVRGTVNFDDMVRNIQRDKVRDARTGVLLHSGFKDLADQVTEFLAGTGLMQRNYRFRLYGHSLGGAVASIVGMHLHQAGERVDAVITFGAPRFTSNQGARRYQALNERTFRIVRCDDVVPFLPPPNALGITADSYQAGGSQFLLLKPPHFDVSKNLEIERDFMHQLRAELAGAGRGRLASGHRMASYVAALAAYPPPDANGAPAWAPVSYSARDQQTFCPVQGW